MLNAATPDIRKLTTCLFIPLTFPFPGQSLPLTSLSLGHAYLWGLHIRMVDRPPPQKIHNIEYNKYRHGVLTLWLTTLHCHPLSMATLSSLLHLQWSRALLQLRHIPRGQPKVLFSPLTCTYTPMGKSGACYNAPKRAVQGQTSVEDRGFLWTRSRRATMPFTKRHHWTTTLCDWHPHLHASNSKPPNGGLAHVT